MSARNPGCGSEAAEMAPWAQRACHESVRSGLGSPARIHGLPVIPVLRW